MTDRSAEARSESGPTPPSKLRRSRAEASLRIDTLRAKLGPAERHEDNQSANLSRLRGRGTMRSMVEGAAPRTAQAAAPFRRLTAPPSPVNGRRTSDCTIVEIARKRRALRYISPQPIGFR